MILGTLRTGWAGPEMRAQLSFGLVPAGLAASCSISDLLLSTTVPGQRGISLGYRFGEIIFFVVTAVQLAWRNSSSNHRRAGADSTRTPARTTWRLLFSFLGSPCWHQVITLMATAFHEAAVVVPLIALSGSAKA
jgi:hypothetical protein